MDEKQLGRIIVAPGVLITIARFTALATPGVVRMGRHWAAGMSRLMGHTSGDGGVAIAVEDQAVTADLYIIAKHDVNLLQMSRQIQAGVTRAIEELVGLNVRAVNVHIQDVVTPER